VYFLTTEEGGRIRSADLLHSCSPYILLADVGLGCTEDGFPIRGWARVELEGDPGYIELGVEQTVQVELRYGEGAVVEPGSSFDLAEGAQVVAKATVIAVLEAVVE
jgi:hypothetical protein